MENKKIKPILQYNTTLRSLRSLQTFFKKNPKTPQVFHTKPSMRDGLEHAMTRAVKSLKYLKKIDFHDYDYVNSIKQSHYLYLLKRAPHNQTIILNSSFFDTSSLFSVKTWLGISKPITTVTLTLEEEESYTEAKIKTLFCMLSCLQIKGLSILDAQVDNISPSHLSLFRQKFPSSLESLTILCRDKIMPEEGLVHSLSHLTNLKKLALEIKARNGLMLALLNSISDYSHLTTLELVIRRRYIEDEYDEDDDIDITDEDMTLVFEGLRKSKTLESVSLEFSLDFMGVDMFLETINECPVTKLNLSLGTGTEGTIDDLLDFLSNSKGFTHLKLDLTFESGSRTIRQDFLRALNEVIAKSSQLEYFYLQTYDLDTSKALKILDALTDKGSTLKYVKLKIADRSGKSLEPSIDQFMKMLKSVGHLPILQVLKLPYICIPADSVYDNIIETLHVLKDLRELTFAQISSPKSLSLFVEFFEMILSKRGIEKFTCKYSPPNKFLKSLQEATDVARINPKYIEMKNPHLEDGPPYPELYRKQSK